MKIITRLKLAAWVPALIALVIGLALLFSYKAMEEAREKGITVHQIQISMNELNSFVRSYMLFHEERPRLQFLKEYDSITRLMATIRFDNSQQQQLLDRIRANSESMKASFVKLVSGYQPRRAVESDALLREAGERLVGQILVRSREVLSDAFHLDSLINDEVTTTQRRIGALIFILIVTTTVPITIVLIRMVRNITTSLATLGKGTEAIRTGNFDHRIGMPAGDELGDLARSFDFMTEQLKVTTVSRDALSKEVEERKRAEEDLRRQREWLRVTLSSIGDAVIASDTEGRITFLNPVAVRLTGWQLDETLGQPIQGVFRIINEKTHEPGEDLVARVLNEKRVVALANDTALVTKDGREVPIEDSAASIKDSAGNLIGVVLVFHDVTERRRAQTALREALGRAAWLARFPDENPNPVLRASADESVLYCNPASVEMHGWACRVGQPLPDPLSLLLRQAMTEGKEAQQDVELGGRFYFVAVTPFPGEGYANFYGRDITERKRAEETLHESERRLTRTQEIAQLGSWELDLINNRLTWSDEVYRIFGLQPQEFGATYEAFLEAVHPDDRAAVDAAYSGSVREGRDIYEIEHRVVKKSTGETRFVHERCEHIRDASGRIIRSVGMVHDITQRKRAEEALVRAKEEWERTFDTVPDLVSILDNQHRIVRVNKAMADRLALTPEQCIGLKCHEAVHGLSDPTAFCAPMPSRAKTANSMWLKCTNPGLAATSW